LLLLKLNEDVILAEQVDIENGAFTYTFNSENFGRVGSDHR